MKFKVQFNMLESQTPLQTKVAINFPYEELELKHSLAERQGNMCVSPQFFSHPTTKKKNASSGENSGCNVNFLLKTAENRGTKVKAKHPSKNCKLDHRKLRNNNRKKQPWMKMYPLLTMAIFHCHVCFQGWVKFWYIEPPNQDKWMFSLGFPTKKVS